MADVRLSLTTRQVIENGSEQSARLSTRLNWNNWAGLFYQSGGARLPTSIGWKLYFGLL